MGDLGEVAMLNHVDSSRQETTAAPVEEEPAGGLVRMTYRLARRIIVAIVGSTLLLIGIVLLVAPGPAFAVIPIGLAVLALEFAWARRWLRRFRTMANDLVAGVRGNGPPDT